MEKQAPIVIIGAGCAGLAAAYELRQRGIPVKVYEKNDVYGGLCRSFTVGGYTFDTFAHVNFSRDPYVRSLLEERTPYLTHVPEAMNYVQGHWVRNPVQNNLVGLPVEERIRIIKDFIARDQVGGEGSTYYDWLLRQYGAYFTDHYPALYTRKYWTVEASQLEEKWIGARMYAPTIDEVLRGAMTKETPNVHYTKEIHYPKEGGYQAFLAPLANEAEIEYRKSLKEIDLAEKTVSFADDSMVPYHTLISTIPLPEVVAGIRQFVPDEVTAAAAALDHTSGVMVSVGLSCGNVAPALWFYIYDEEIYPARVYAPNIKSPHNVPPGCAALQAEVYYSRYKPLRQSIEEIRDATVSQLIAMGLFTPEDVRCVDVRQETYANIMFTPAIYVARQTVRDYLTAQGIITAGRFGEWDYLWTGESLLSGREAARRAMEVHGGRSVRS